MIEMLRGQRRRWHVGLRVGALAVQVSDQGDGAPLFDDAYLTTEDGRRFAGTCVRLRVRAETGSSCPALVVAWREKNGMPVKDRVALAVAERLPNRVLRWAVIRANARAAQRFPDEHAICDAAKIVRAIDEEAVR